MIVIQESRQARWQKKMRAQGRCPECGKKSGKYFYCDFHRAKARARVQKKVK